MEESTNLPARVIAFLSKDPNTSPELAAMGVADTDGLGREYSATGMNVRLCDATAKDTEIWVPVTGPGDLETIQHFFTAPIRAVSRKELIKGSLRKNHE